MRRFFSYLFIIVPIYAFADEKSIVDSIRFDGIYKENPKLRKTEPINSITDIEPEENDLDYCHYVRFYPDGQVIDVISDCDSAAIAEIKKWFSLANKDVSFSRGRYTLENKKIYVSSTNNGQTKKFDGDV